MKRFLLILFTLIMVFMPKLTAQEKIISEVKENKKSKTQNPDYLQIQQLNIERGEDWWQPDTIIHYRGHNIDDLRKIFIYNSTGNITEILYQTYYNSKWNDSERYLYDYNTNNYLVFEIYQIYDNEWINKYLDIFNYNIENNLDEITSHMWDNGSWMYLERYSCKYDYRNNKTSELYQDWSKYDIAWKNVDQYTYTYDNKSNLLTELFEEWKDGVWKSNYKATYTYYEKNNKMKTELWGDYYDNQWNNWYYGFFFYDENDTIIEYLQKEWNYNSWTDRYREQYEYDNNNMILLTVSTYKNDNWENSRRYLYSFDSNNLLSYTEQLWETTNSDWHNFKREVYRYDNHDNTVDVTYQDYEFDWSDSKNLSFVYDDNDNCIKGEVWMVSEGNWENYNDRFKVYYNNNKSIYNVNRESYKVQLTYTKTPKPAGIEEIEPSTSEIAIYPNPSKDYINISVENDEIKNVQIYNLTGKLVKQEKSNKINVSNLPVGMYIIKVETDGGNCIKKVIKD